MKIVNILLAVVLLSFTLGQLTRWQITGQPIVINFSEILVSITVLSWLVGIILHRQKINFYPAGKLIFLFFGIGLTSLIISLRLFLFQEVVWGSLYLWRWIIFAGLYFLVTSVVAVKEITSWLKIIFLTGMTFSFLVPTYTRLNA